MATKKVSLPTKAYPQRGTSGAPTHPLGHPGGGGGGGGGGILLGPFTVTFETAGAVDPSNNGVVAFPRSVLPTGALVMAWPVITVAWDTDGQLDLSAGDGTDGVVNIIGSYQRDTPVPQPEYHTAPNILATTVGQVVSRYPRPFVPTGSTDILVATYSGGGGPASAGAFDVYALVFAG